MCCIWPYRIQCTAYLLALALIRTYVCMCICRRELRSSFVGGLLQAKGGALHHTGYYTKLTTAPYCILATPDWLRRTGYHTILAITPYCILAYGRQAPSALSPVALRLLSPMLSDWAAPHHTTPHQIAPHQTPRTQHNSYSGRAVDASSSVSLCV